MRIWPKRDSGIEWDFASNEVGEMYRAFLFSFCRLDDQAMMMNTATFSSFISYNYSECPNTHRESSMSSQERKM